MGDKDKRRNTSLRLRRKTLKALKMAALEQDTSVQQLVETLIEAYLAERKETSK
ncbi:MAG: CopG family transcriptional regulator [Myxococcota bacterium]